MISFLSLGSNIGDRFINLKKSISLINKSKKINLLLKSKIYETSPMENLDQNNFLNQVIKINTKLEPLDLLSVIKGIECRMGRRDSIDRYMPRIIDIDILTYDKLLFSHKDLVIPHPKIKLRKFILKPWSDIAPDYILTNGKSTIKELLDKIICFKDKVEEYN